MIKRNNVINSFQTIYRSRPFIYYINMRKRVHYALIRSKIKKYYDGNQRREPIYLFKHTSTLSHISERNKQSSVIYVYKHNIWDA